MRLLPSLGVALVSVGAIAVAPAQARSQSLTLFAAGAAAVPVGGYRGVADLGYQGFLGAETDLGRTALTVGAAAFYGANPHGIAGERSKLYGVSVLAGYTVAQPYGVDLSLLAGLGAMIHARRSDAFPGLDASKRGLSVSTGVSLSRPVGRMGVFVSGLYVRGLGKLNSASYPTELFLVAGGVSVPLSVD